MLSFVAGYDLVSYYDGTVSSHACDPSDPSACAYTNVISIPDEFAPSPGSTEKVLGISGATNAHVEINTETNYLYDLNLKAGIFSGGTCEFTTPSGSCGSKNCIFGLSGLTNAHISECDKFTPEVKFCCDFTATTVMPVIQEGKCGITSFEAGKTIPIEVKLTCNVDKDFNLYIFDNLGSQINTSPLSLDCNSDGVTKSLSAIDFEENKVYLFRLINGDCVSEKFSAVEKENNGFAIPDYNIFSIVLSLMLVLIIIMKVNKDE